MKIERRFHARSLVLGLGGLLVLVAAATPSLKANDMTYNYTGAPFTNGGGGHPFTGDSLTASFTLSSALPDNQTSANDLSLVVSWTISDGAGHTASSTNGGSLADFTLSTNNLGIITAWNISATDSGDYEAFYTNYPELYGQVDGANRSGYGEGWNETRGTFGPAPVPEEPAAFDLVMCTALIALIALAIKARNGSTLHGVSC
jgi:hypothetical protein